MIKLNPADWYMNAHYMNAHHMLLFLCGFKLSKIKSKIKQQNNNSSKYPFSDVRQEC